MISDGGETFGLWRIHIMVNPYIRIISGKSGSNIWSIFKSKVEDNPFDHGFDN